MNRLRRIIAVTTATVTLPATSVSAQSPFKDVSQKTAETVEAIRSDTVESIRFLSSAGIPK